MKHEILLKEPACVCLCVYTVYILVYSPFQGGVLWDIQGQGQNDNENVHM